MFMATNEVRAEKERDFTESAPDGEGALGFDNIPLQGESTQINDIIMIALRSVCFLAITIVSTCSNSRGVQE